MSSSVDCDRRAAFSIIELLVVISVVVLLTGIALTAGSTFYENAQVSRTEQTLRLLDEAVQAWENEADRKLTWGAKGTHDVWEERAEEYIISEILSVIGRSGHVRDVIAQIDPDLVFTYPDAVEWAFPAWVATPQALQQYPEVEGHLTIFDAWGDIPIYATHPGSLWQAGEVGPDEDGTERTNNEMRYGIARNRNVCFISAGPDRRFGLDNEFPELTGIALEQAILQARQDNIYSYPVVVPGGGDSAGESPIY